jgi:anti-sigma factor RsiW
MTHAYARSQFGAWLDGELDAATRAELEAHVEGCAACGQALDRQRTLSELLRAKTERLAAPGALRDWAMRAARGEATARGYSSARGAGVPQRTSDWRGSAGTRRNVRAARPAPSLWARLRGLGFASVTLAALAVLTTPVVNRALDQAALARELVSGHVRSLEAEHLTDVVSTDQHTVKPWFNGRLDFSPPVVDLADAGFPLAGGRLDYAHGRTVAALVFHRRQHPINLYVWPASSWSARLPWLTSLAGRVTGGGPITRDGYHLEHRVVAGMECWAISDLNAVELHEFVTRFAARVDSSSAAAPRP